MSTEETEYITELLSKVENLINLLLWCIKTRYWKSTTRKQATKRINWHNIKLEYL